MNQKIQKMIKENENDFFIAYKEQMHKIQTELRILKKKVLFCQKIKERNKFIDG